MSFENIPIENLDPWLVTWDIGSKMLESIRDYAQEVHYPEGTVIFSAGDAPDAMYLILEGMVVVKAVDEEGNEKTSSLITEGQSFGEVGLLIQQTRLATTVAGLNVRLLKIDTDALHQLEHDRPQVLIKMYRILAKTLAEQWIQSEYAHQEGE